MNERFEIRSVWSTKQDISSEVSFFRVQTIVGDTFRVRKQGIPPKSSTFVSIVLTATVWVYPIGN